MGEDVEAGADAVVGTDEDAGMGAEVGAEANEEVSAGADAGVDRGGRCRYGCGDGRLSVT